MDFNIGDGLEIVRDGKQYRTIVERQIDESTLVIYTPIEKARAVPIRQDETLELIFPMLEPQSQKYDVYSFKATVIARQLLDNISMLKVKAISTPEKIQRRDFYRLNIVKSMLIEKLHGEGTIEIITKDVSAGGMMVVSPKQLKVDDEYLVYMNIFAESPLVLTAKVLSNEQNSKDKEHYICRFVFTNVDKKVQGALITQINHLQVLELRRRKYNSPSYKEALKASLDDELLDRYNIDKNVDKKIRYLMFVNIALVLVVVILFLMASPNTTWAPFFGRQVQKSWDYSLIKIDTFLSTALFILSGLGLVFDRTHYQGRKQVNMFFVVVFLFSLFTLLGFITFVTSVV